MKQRIYEWLMKCQDSILLNELKSNQDENDLYDRFYKDLSFGTGGLRGLMGVGTNRMNIYTVRQATQGISNSIQKLKLENLKVVIGYDSRLNSKRFAEEVACVFASNHFHVYLFDDLRPAPEVSFAVRELQCDIGIVITASHNPKEYNGYKVYGSDGGQITLELAEKFSQSITEVNPFEIHTSKFIDYKNNQQITLLDTQFDDLYLKRILDLPIFKHDFPRNANIVYTPIHGSGYQLVKRVLDLKGYTSVSFVEEQVEPDGNFPTVKSPNPEEKEALDLGIALAQRINADLVLGTDPDCDRVGISVRDGNQMVLLTGNQVGALLVNFMLETHPSISSRTAIVKTIVTSDLGKKIAESYGATVFETLTGFKYIGEKIEEFEKNGKYDFLLGFEESYGYLTGTFVRDKDAVIASLLITEMYSYYASKNKSLISVLKELYLKFGEYQEKLYSYSFKGDSGSKKIKEFVVKFSDIAFIKEQFDGVECIENYQLLIKYHIDGETNRILLPKSDVIKVIFKNGSWFAIRPSGTEPKLKIYISELNFGNSRLYSKIEDLIA